MEAVQSLASLAMSLRACVEAAHRDRTFAAAEEVCRVTREFWFAYHEQWLVDHRQCQRHRRQAESDLERGLLVVGEIRSASTADSTESRELLSRYEQSVRRRRDLMRLLHSVDDPEQGAALVYEQVRRELSA